MFCVLWVAGVDPNKTPMSAVYQKFGLEPGTQDFIGHAMALFLDDGCVDARGAGNRVGWGA
jgi:RAB protein geranylgeranyltransferase component A